MSQSTDSPSTSRCLSCSMRLSFINLGANLALAVLKALVGIMAGSRALVAAALYSINDVLSALIVMMSLRVAREPADEEHAYGHGKVEFIAIAIVSLVLAAGVFFILYFSLIDIIRGQSHSPHAIALFVAALAMCANFMLARRGFCAAERLGSPALQSAAEHNRADAISSLAVLLGVACATLGLHVMDRLVAIFEALHILWLGGKLFGTSLKGLMDSAIDPADVRRIRRACRRVDGVSRVLQLRTRMAGSDVLADVIIAVSAQLSVDEAQAIAARVRRAIDESLTRPVQAHVGFRPEALPAGAGQRPHAGESHA